MSNYRNIEINLLPPELQPPPTVRTAVILNAAIILGVVSYIILTTLNTFGQVRVQQQQIKEAEQLVKTRQPIVAMYNDLSAVKEQVDKYGRLVSLASIDYIDVPVLLDRLAKVIPAGVYLNSVTNDKSAPNSRSTIVRVSLMTSGHDPALMQAALDAMKSDSIFGDCYLSNAEVRREAINSQLASYGIDWQATGPDVPNSLDVNKYEFSIMANVPKLLDTSSLPVKVDQSIYLADVEFKTPPPAEETDEKGKPSKAGARKPGDSKPEREASNAPKGVKPVGVN